METTERSALNLSLPCRHLRSKEMFHQGTAPDDEFASGVFWCNKTHENFGPDGDEAANGRCCASRSCYNS